MKIKKATIITLLLFLIIIGIGYFILPLIMHITNYSSIINEQTNITNEFLLSSEEISSRIFEPIKNKHMGTQITSKELELLYTEVNSFDLPLEDTAWFFDLNTSFYSNDIGKYLYNNYYVAIQSTSKNATTYVFDPYSLYIVEHVKHSSSIPNSSQIQLAFNALQYDSSLSSKKLISYSEKIEAFAGLYSYQKFSFIPNNLYYYMYINKAENASNFIAYNYTKSYTFLDCIKLGEKTIQFDGTLFAVTYFVNEYGIILYYNPITQEYCGYSIIDTPL
jgi:hypothetical protein